jgi:Ran GTPase-activating protein (RanGAP) involved in mRNA processing and transport
MYLDLSSCDLSSLDAGILAAELTENATVKNLILARNPIGPAGVEVIAKACQGKASLTNLQLSFTMMGLHGARALGRTLAMKQTAIHTLKLTDNHIGDGGARGLARALRVNTALTSLALDGNHIGPSGAEAIASALAKNSTFVLSLSRNEIGDVGALAFAEVLCGGSAVVTNLDLGDNRISDVGAKRLAWAVSKLAELHLSENPYIGPASGQAFLDGLVMNTTLVILNLQGTNVGSHAEARIGEALLDNIEKKINKK